MVERPRTDFLFTAGGMLVGAGSVFNIAGSYFAYNTAADETDADARAIASDWLMVGQDMQNALSSFPKADAGTGA